MRLLSLDTSRWRKLPLNQVELTVRSNNTGSLKHSEISPERSGPNAAKSAL